MAISPESFFNHDTSMILAEKAKRDQSDIRLDNSFQILGVTILRLSNELSAFSNAVVTGQRQENKIINDYIADVSAEKKPTLRESISASFGGGLGSIIPSPEKGKTETQNIMKMLAGGLAAGGLAGIISNVLSQSPGGAPGTPSGSLIGGSAPPEIKSLMEVISGPESGGNYEALNPNTTLPGATKMTIAQVAQASGGRAVGRYQNLGIYLEERARLAGLDYNKDLYSPENQDKMTRAHIASLLGGEQKAVDSLRKDPKSVARRLNRTWTSFPGGEEQQLDDQQFIQRYQSNLKKYQPQSSTKPTSSTSSRISTQPTSSTEKTNEPTRIVPVDISTTKPLTSSQIASSIIPSTEEVPSSTIITSVPSQMIAPSPPATPNRTNFATGSANAGNWYSDVQRLTQGIAFSVG